jgi:hypothetical protein
MDRWSEQLSIAEDLMQKSVRQLTSGSRATRLRLCKLVLRSLERRNRAARGRVYADDNGLLHASNFKAGET